MVDQDILTQIGAESIFKDGINMLSPKMAVKYSFEYCFRLFLVYCYTRKSTIASIKAEQDDAFDTMFDYPLCDAIKAILDDKNLVIDEEKLKYLTNEANNTLVGYLKSSMRASQAKIASTLAKSFDKYLRDTGVWGEGSGYVTVFAEETRF